MSERESYTASWNSVHFLVTLFTGCIFLDGVRRESLTHVAARHPFFHFLLCDSD